MYEIKQYDYRGKVKIVLEGQSLALCKLWALQNTKGKSSTFVYNESGDPIYLVEGQGKDKFPEIHDITSVLC